MKRKAAVSATALALSVGLLLGACSSGDVEDPQAALKQDATAAQKHNGQRTTTSSDGEEVIISEESLFSEEEMRAAEEELKEIAPDPMTQEELENADIPVAESDINDTNLGGEFESDFYGVDVDSIEIPDEVKEAYSDHDTSRIVPALLEALDWAEYNNSARTVPLDDYEIESRTEYMSGYLTAKGEQSFRDSLNGDKDPLLAFSLMPYYVDTFTWEGEELQVSQYGSWTSGVGNVRVTDINGVDGVSLGGVRVDFQKTTYVPLESDNYLALNIGMSVSMSPSEKANDNDWIINDWSMKFLPGSEVVGVNEVL